MWIRSDEQHLVPPTLGHSHELLCPSSSHRLFLSGGCAWSLHVLGAAVAGGSFSEWNSILMCFPSSWEIRVLGGADAVLVLIWSDWCLASLTSFPWFDCRAAVFRLIKSGLSHDVIKAPILIATVHSLSLLSGATCGSRVTVRVSIFVAAAWVNLGATHQM